MDPQLDPRQTARLTATLKAEIPALAPKLALAAKYIIDAPGDFALDPIRISANKAGISANTFIRLAEHLQFAGFEDLRAPFRAALITEREAALSDTWLSQMEKGREPLAPRQAQAAENEINIVTRSLRKMTPEKTAAIVAAIRASHRCYITATRASYALAHFLHYVGRMALPQIDLVPRHMGSAIDDMMDLNEKDCLIAITLAPYSAGTVEAIRHAQKSGATIILISDSEIIAPGLTADHILLVASNSLHAFGGYAGAMAVIECLLTHLIDQGGPTAQKRIEDYEALRQGSGAYFSAKLPRTRF